MVLAYPVLSADLQSSAPGNEFFFNQILYDVITGLWSDVEREAPPPRRRPQDVPVPNRALTEQLLVNQGYVIEGDSAVRPRKGLLGSVLGAFVEDRRTLPPEGSSDDYLRLAEEALGAVAGWPAPRARALRACLGGGRAPPPLPGRAAAPRIVGALPEPPPPPRHRGGTAALDGGLHRGSHQGRRSRAAVRRWIRTGAASGARLMAGQGPARRRRADGEGARPDWMKDFES